MYCGEFLHYLVQSHIKFKSVSNRIFFHLQIYIFDMRNRKFKAVNHYLFLIFYIII